MFWELMWPAVLGTAVSHPPPQQLESLWQPASACLLLQEATTQSQFLAWLLTPPYLSVISHQESGQDPLERGGAQGQQSPFILFSIAPVHGKPACNYFSVFPSQQMLLFI